ncbi:MAG: hypothetical protein L0H83_13960 [Salinisphaera sp.]|nr:hypothetical protein [Salinisphaera sp.]
MARMSIRATYALDEQTDQHIKQLAKTWHVSQAEVIRRSVRAAADQNSEAMTPADVVAHYAKVPLPRNRAETRRLVESLRAWRHADDDRRAPRS